MRTAIVHSNFNGRYIDKEIAAKKAAELGGEVCYLWYTNIGVECSFGYAVAKGDDIIGCDDFKWI